MTESIGTPWRRAQGPGFAVALLVSVLVGGTLGYVLIERWSLWDAFYMTVITITTVGYREVHTLSRPGEVFTVFLVFGGVGAALYTATLLATAVVEGGVPTWIARWRQVRMLESIKDHFILCGYGRIGSIVARELHRQNVPFIIVERDPERLRAAANDGALVVEGDASREDVLQHAGLARARGLIAAVGTDAENVYAVLSARLLRPDLFIIGRSETDEGMTILKRAGADRVMSPYQIGAVQMAQTALRPAVVDFVALATSYDNLELAMEEVSVAPSSPLINRSLLDASLRQRFGVIVVGIQHEDLRMDFNPAPETEIRGGDKLVVLGRAPSLRQLEAEASSPAGARQAT